MIEEIGRWRRLIELGTQSARRCSSRRGHRVFFGASIIGAYLV